MNAKNELEKSISETKDALCLHLLSWRIPMMITEIKVFYNKYAYYVCPRCHVTMEWEFQSYCDRCGQRLDWKEYRKAKVIYVEKR